MRVLRRDGSGVGSVWGVGTGEAFEPVTLEYSMLPEIILAVSKGCGEL